jgi:putative hemolysin
MDASRRWGVRGLVVLAVTLVTVLALATAADAVTVRIFTVTSADVVEDLCRKDGGSLTTSTDAKGVTTTVCVFPDGEVITCVGTSCVGVVPRKLQPLLDDIRAVGGTQVREPSPDSKVWVETGPKNINTVGVLQQAGCSDLGGEFVSSPDGTVGQCRTPTATVVCQKIKSKSTCAGFADTKKHAASTRKKVKASLKTSSTTTPGGSTTTSGATTTTTGATTTTRPTTPTTRG